MECEFHTNTKKQAGKVCWRGACALLTRRDCCRPDRAFAWPLVCSAFRNKASAPCVAGFHRLMTTGQQINPDAKKMFMSDVYIACNVESVEYTCFYVY